MSPVGIPVDLVRVIHCANEGYFPVDGKAVGDVRKGLRDTFSLAKDSIAQLNGCDVDDSHRLKGGDNLEFYHRWGRKGGLPDFWSEEEIAVAYGPDAPQSLCDFGYEPVTTNLGRSIFSFGDIKTWHAQRQTELTNNAATSDALIVNIPSGTIQYRDQEVSIDDSLKYHVLKVLASNQGQFVDFTTLKHLVWDDDSGMKTTNSRVSREISKLRKSLSDLGLIGVELRTGRLRAGVWLS